MVGTGYLGATHAVCMASLGYDVIGLDVDQAKVDALSAGRVPFFEPGLEPLLDKQLATGRLRFTTSYQEAAEHGDVHFICVGTPQRKDANAADLGYVDSAVEGLAPLLTRPCTVEIGRASCRERV